MKFDELLSEKKIEKVEKAEINLGSVERDIEFAVNGMETENYNRVMAVAYEGVLRAGNKLMNFLGYRAIGREHHKNLFEFLKKAGFDDEAVDYFNKIRVKRNAFVYRDIEGISKKEVEEILEKAESFVQKTRTFVQEIRTEVKNG